MEPNIDIKIYLTNKDKPLAKATVSLETIHFGPLTIKGFMIWRSDIFNERLGDNINITPPSVKSRFKYIKQIFFEDAVHWEIVEQRIYEAYRCEGGRPTPSEEIIDLDKLAKEVNQHS